MHTKSIYKIIVFDRISFFFEFSKYLRSVNKHSILLLQDFRKDSAKSLANFQLFEQNSKKIIFYEFFADFYNVSYGWLH